ncbi:MAG: PrgI family protein [Candidatus Pacebacteria bacterium]|nr:PrgI family protein [Candidatus Paceibacterota bacterium]
MRFAVPQFIEVEDKIFGPLTWRQFVYLAGGGGVAVILFLTASFLVFLLIGLPIIILAGFLAFHKINNRPFSVFLESVINYFANEKLFLWRRSESQVITEKSPRMQSSDTYIAPTSKDGLASLSRKLELNALEAEK